MRRLLLGACLCALLSTPAMAQTVRIRLDAPAPPAVSVQPRWMWDAEERVYIANDPNIDYDAFRYGQYYYIYNDGYWYRASGWNSRFDAIEDVSVPRVLFNLPESRYQWRSQRPVYGSSRWDDRDDDRYRYVRSQPQWQWIPSRQIYVAVNSDRDYDLYRSGSWYYLEDNGTWFRASSWNGPYAMIEMNSIPRTVYTAWRSGSNNNNNDATPVVRMRPRWRWMPRERVYVAVNGNRDYDMYRFGGWYYINDNDNWYRANSWNGPYVLIQDRSVPRAVFSVTNWRDRDWRDRRRY